MPTTKKANKNKATHSGHCQICGASQKLPNGVLSKHGYNVQWGFFSGVCNGAGSLPFEQSCDLVEAAIKAAAAQIFSIAERIEKLRQQGGSRAWVESYIVDSYTRKGSYKWVEVEVRKVHHVSRDGFEYDQIVTVREDGKESKTYESASEENAVANAVAKMNGQYINRVWVTRIAQLEQYIAWQQERVENWKPAELTPVK